MRAGGGATDALKSDRDGLEKRGFECYAVVKMGGDEFVVLIENRENLNDISACERRLVEEFDDG